MVDGRSPKHASRSPMLPYQLKPRRQLEIITNHKRAWKVSLAHTTLSAHFQLSPKTVPKLFAYFPMTHLHILAQDRQDLVSFEKEVHIPSGSLEVDNSRHLTRFIICSCMRTCSGQMKRETRRLTLTTKNHHGRADADTVAMQSLWLWIVTITTLYRL